MLYDCTPLVHPARVKYCNAKNHTLFSTALWKSVFDDVDKDKSGRISCVELHNLLKEMGFAVQLNELKDWVRKHDKNQDGEMDFQEFMAFMSSTGA